MRCYSVISRRCVTFKHNTTLHRAEHPARSQLAIHRPLLGCSSPPAAARMSHFIDAPRRGSSGTPAGAPTEIECCVGLATSAGCRTFCPGPTSESKARASRRCPPTGAVDDEVKAALGRGTVALRGSRRSALPRDWRCRQRQWLCRYLPRPGRHWAIRYMWTDRIERLWALGKRTLWNCRNAPTPANQRRAPPRETCSLAPHRSSINGKFTVAPAAVKTETEPLQSERSKLPTPWTTDMPSRLAQRAPERRLRLGIGQKRHLISREELPPRLTSGIRENSLNSRGWHLRIDLIIAPPSPSFA